MKGKRSTDRTNRRSKFFNFDILFGYLKKILRKRGPVTSVVAAIVVIFLTIALFLFQNGDNTSRQAIAGAHYKDWSTRAEFLEGQADANINVSGTNGSDDSSLSLKLSAAFSSNTLNNGVPARRSDATAVWTGTEMIVWGGTGSSVRLSSGGKYNPTSNQWATIYENQAPGMRGQHTATFDANNKYPAENWNVKEDVNSARIRFTTDVPTIAYVDYGQGDVSQEAGGEPTLATGHEVVIKNLKSGTDYRYRLRFFDADDNMGTNPADADTNPASYYTFTTGQADVGFDGDPSASNLSQVEITASTAKITWKTKLPTTSWVDYGLTTEYGNTAGDDNLTTAHIVELKNLVAGQTYYYRVRGLDAGENEFVSSDFSFKAIMKPSISEVKVEKVDSYSAEISWITNVKTDSDVVYGETTTYSNRQKDEGLLTVHSVTLDKLTDDTTYHFQVEARDEYGNTTKSQDYSFATPLDTAGPKVEDVRIDIIPMESEDETAQVIVSWKTDKPSTGRVDYGEGLIGGVYEKATIEDSSLNYSHTAIIKGLNPAATYHLRLVSKDKRNNKTESLDYNIVTPEKQNSIWQLIVRSLEETFRWVKDTGSFFRGLVNKVK